LKAKKVLGTIHLSECLELRDGDAETRHSNTLALTTPSRKYYIQAENKAEIDDWFKVIVPLVSSSTISKNRISSVVNQSNDEFSVQTVSKRNIPERSMTMVSQVTEIFVDS
jgi:hypothetical protein